MCTHRYTHTHTHVHKQMHTVTHTSTQSMHTNKDWLSQPPPPPSPPPPPPPRHTHIATLYRTLTCSTFCHDYSWFHHMGGHGLVVHQVRDSLLQHLQHREQGCADHWHADVRLPCNMLGQHNLPWIDDEHTGQLHPAESVKKGLARGQQCQATLSDTQDAQLLGTPLVLGQLGAQHLQVLVWWHVIWQVVQTGLYLQPVWNPLISRRTL